MGGKICFGCGEEKPLDAFYGHPQMSDGHLGKCKECTKQDARAHRWANVDRIRECDRKRGHRSSPGYYRRRKEDSPEKYAALLAMNAVRRRKGFERPARCSDCGAISVHIEGHHEDYTKPFSVVWLCPQCHRNRHYGNPRVVFEQGMGAAT